MHKYYKSPPLCCCLFASNVLFYNHTGPWAIQIPDLNKLMYSWMNINVFFINLLIFYEYLIFVQYLGQVSVYRKPLSCVVTTNDGRGLSNFAIYIVWIIFTRPIFTLHFYHFAHLPNNRGNAILTLLPFLLTTCFSQYFQNQSFECIHVNLFKVCPPSNKSLKSSMCFLDLESNHVLLNGCVD